MMYYFLCKYFQQFWFSGLSDIWGVVVDRIELDKAVVLVWLDWLVFCDYGFIVPALWCPLATPTVLLGFLVPWTWAISSWLLQQSAATTPYLGRGVSSHHRPSWPWTWSSSSRSSCIQAYTAPVLCPPHVKSWLIGKDSDAGRDWGQEEEGTTEDEMVGWHHRLDEREFEWTPGDGYGQGGLVCWNVSQASWNVKSSGP